MHLCVVDQPSPATLEFHARSAVDPSRLAELLSIAILGCGGWIVEQSEPQEGALSLLWEFECERALEIYGVLVALGIELSRNAHLNLTRLWQCARHGHCLKRLPVTRIRMTVQTGSLPPLADVPKLPPCAK